MALKALLCITYLLLCPLTPGSCGKVRFSWFYGYMFKTLDIYVFRTSKWQSETSLNLNLFKRKFMHYLSLRIWG
jgi:hypothetical protein